MSQVRCAAGVSLALMAMMCGAAAAQAADNVRISGSFSVIAHHLCADPIRIDGSYDEVMHTYYDSSGNAVRLAFTGHVSISYTNLNTSATYEPNSSGPSTVDLQTGQQVLRGGNGALFDSNGVLIATDGRAILDANGNPISLPNHTGDVCAQVGSTSF